jgi:endoglycosylceramidase
VDRVLVIGRVVIVLLVALVAAVTYPGALLVSMATLVTPAPAPRAAPAGTMSWLHVAHPSHGTPFIADDKGRMVLLHGAIPASLIEFGPGSQPLYPIDPTAYDGGRCPANSSSSRYPPLCQSDLSAMAALGFNSVRLPISWSVLEPERGRMNAMYVDRIAQVVEWARALRMYVIIDMHQNAYSHYIPTGNDVDLSYNSGAPAWATFTDGFPSQVYKGERELNPAVFEAATNFWFNRDGIQAEYIKAVAFVARRFVADSAVAGYGLYNEPWAGWNLPPGFDDLLLFPFYRRLIDGVTGASDGLPCWTGFYLPAVCGFQDLGVHDTRHLMFLDTGLMREVTDFPTHLATPISSYPNLVLALHAYTHIYTFDALAGQKAANATYPWGGYDQSYAWAEREAGAMRAALFVSEFGNDPGDDPIILRNQLLEMERHDTGFAFWTWKENGGDHAWGMFDATTDCMRPQREAMLAMPYPQATADPGASFHYDPANGLFWLHANGFAGDPTTVVYMPKEVGGDISSGGAVTLVVSAGEGDGSRLAFATPTGGAFTIGISPAPLRLSGCAG